MVTPPHPHERELLIACRPAAVSTTRPRQRDHHRIGAAAGHATNANEAAQEGANSDAKENALPRRPPAGTVRRAGHVEVAHVSHVLPDGRQLLHGASFKIPDALQAGLEAYQARCSR
jgi:hypothetical protein